MSDCQNCENLLRRVTRLERAAVEREIDRSELELAVQALAEVPVEALGPLGRVAVVSGTHQRLREAQSQAQGAVWAEQIRRAKGAA